MDWSATLSLTTSRARQHKANYGSFARTSSSSSIRIPQSIPENQCVLQFASPRCRISADTRFAELPERAVDAQSHGGGGRGGTMTLTATKTTTAPEQRTFKMLLTRPTVTTALLSDANNRIEPLSSSASGRAGTVSSYWVQERERRRQRRNGSPTKGSPTSSDRDDAPSSVWRTVFIMCSVPLALVLIFVLVVLVLGDGRDAASALSMPNLFRRAPTTALLRSVQSPSPGHHLS
ncbi:hypothetical protein P43SY_001787 [Pythium insidiosum]|uniref:Uncharacterized protein n=1 Tax=Pythium insidiosum TaxID=114742 RepID=A0AAD5LFN3_PYTIN|nr:hypothetical protein P43SY_001787 [Pythium insidiosum]